MMLGTSDAWAWQIRIGLGTLLTISFAGCVLTL